MCAQRVVVIKFHSCNQRVVCGIRRQIKFAVRYGNISSMAQIISSSILYLAGTLFKSDIVKRSSDGKGGKKTTDKVDDKKNGVVSSTPPTTEAPATQAAPVNPQRLYSNAEIKLLQTYISPLVYKVTFDDLSLSEAEIPTVLFAELRLFKRKKILDNPQIKQDTNPTEMVEIYQVWNSTRVRGGKEIRFITSQNIGSENDEFVAFSVTDAIKNWHGIRNESSNTLHFEIRVRPPQSITSGLPFLPSIEFDVPNFGKGDHNAQLVVAIPSVDRNTQITQQLRDSASQSSNHERQKRQTVLDGISSNYCRNNPEEPNCCLRELILDFHKDLNMTWVLAPTKLDVNYCEGMCPSYWPVNTHSSYFLREYRKDNPLSSPEPCCAPASTRNITLVVFLDNMLYFNFLEDMIVDSCACR